MTSYLISNWMRPKWMFRGNSTHAPPTRLNIDYVRSTWIGVSNQSSYHLVLLNWNPRILILQKLRKTKFVELEKYAAKDSMTLLQTVLNDREQTEKNLKSVFEKALKGMLSDDNSKLSASDKVLSQLLKKENASQLSNYIKREGKWRESPVLSSDIFTALSKGPKRSTIKPNPPTLGSIPRVANLTNFNNQNPNNFQNQRPTRENPYYRWGTRSGFRGGNNQDPTSLSQNCPSSSAAKQPTEHMTRGEKQLLQTNMIRVKVCCQGKQCALIQQSKSSFQV